MPFDFHESFSQDEVALSSPRSTGIVFAVVSAIAAAMFYPELRLTGICLALSIWLGLVSWLRPALLTRLSILWFRFGLLLHRVVNPIIMFAIFVIVIVPAGLIMQVFRDPLQKKRVGKAESYWVPYEVDEGTQKSMRNQF